MAKYIDLLRAHQQSSSRKPEVVDERERVASDGFTDTESLVAMLPEEKESDFPEGSACDLTFPNELPSEETPASNTPVTTGELPSEEIPASTNAPMTTAETSTENDWLTSCIRLTLDIFRNAEAGDATDISLLARHLGQLVQRIAKDPEAVNALELDVSRHTFLLDDIDADLNSLVQKSIMMMLYAIKVGLQLKLSHKELLAQTLAAMLHHVGMARVPAAIRNKKSKLNKQELQRISRAPEDAVHYLQQCGIDDITILQAARQAQERFDGSGPQRLSGSQIAFSARLVSLLSIFESMIHYRPYRKRLLPRDAIRELVNHYKQAFDPVILKALIEAISLYPVGTYVQLNSGDIGQVIRVHLRLPLRPLIELRFNNELQPITSREIDLKSQPNLMVKHCMYEENLEQFRKENSKGR